MKDEIIVIGDWKDSQSISLCLQDFITEGTLFIPIFSDETQFLEQIQGSGFEHKGIAIDRKLFGSMLTGDELLILNPGGPNPIRMRKVDLVGVNQI